MASSMIHVAIAKKYLENHQGLDYEKVLAGTLYPDTVEDKAKTHYTDLNRGKDNVSHLRGKVSLYPFLEEHKTLDDFELGWFIHLVTDYLFFDECFTKEYLLATSYEDFRKDLYYAYDRLNIHLLKKYNITENDYKDYPNEYYPGVPYEDCIFSKKMIDDFIERVYSIDLDEYIKKILEYKGNVKP